MKNFIFRYAQRAVACGCMVLVLILSGCKKTGEELIDPSGVDPNAHGVISYEINGKKYTDNDAINIGSDYDDDDKPMVSFFSVPAEATDAYLSMSIGGWDGKLGKYVIDSRRQGVFIFVVPFQKDLWEANSDNEVVLTSYKNNIVTGTFRGTLVHQDGKKANLSVTNGKFQVRVAPFKK